LEGIDDYTRFSNLVFDDDTVLQNDPKKLYTEYGQFYPHAQEKTDIKYLVKGTDYATAISEDFKVGPLPFLVGMWRYMDYFDSSVPSFHDLVTGFW
jgi:hypothetical protein